MEVYEALTLMISFGSLVALLPTSDIGNLLQVKFQLHLKFS
ncbi:putative holin-like toxin [Desulfitobacterium chlororespirans]